MFMSKTWKIIGAVLLSGALLLSGCGSSEETNSSADNSGKDEKTEKTYKIGLTQYAEHPSLDAATKGFKQALEDAGLKVEYDEQNAQADMNNANTIASNFVSAGVDLIFANATPNAQAALNATKDIPIIFTSVTDAVTAGLVEANDKPGDNITGTLDNHPDAIPNTIKFIDQYFDGKKVGTIYNAGEQNSVKQIELIKEAMEGTDLELVEATVSQTSEVKQSAESLIGKVDFIYIITDNTVVTGLESVIQVANDNDIPLFVGELDSVARGGFAAYGFEYYDIGYEAGQMAIQVLKGEKKPSEIPVQPPQRLKLVLNKKAAEEQNIEWNDEWNDIAEIIE